MLRSILASVTTTILSAGTVLAYGGEEAAVQSFFDRTIVFLSTTVGESIFIIGIIYTGIRLAAHDDKALQKGVWVVVGGVLIFMAPIILRIVQSFVR